MASAEPRCDEIVLYDIPSEPPLRAWSPNTWKGTSIRFSSPMPSLVFAEYTDFPLRDCSPHRSKLQVYSIYHVLD